MLADDYQHVDDSLQRVTENIEDKPDMDDEEKTLLVPSGMIVMIKPAKSGKRFRDLYTGKQP